MIHTDPPTTTKLGSPTADQSHQQVQRILKSATFRNAVTLQQLLQFLTARAIEGSGEDLKEYTIGVEAFGRPQDFDPKIDTIVRVQIHRLRQKLTEYYDADGSRDPVIVEIPKGHYLPSFEAVRDSGKDNELDPSPESGTSVSAAKPFTGLNAENVGTGVGRKKGRLGSFFLSRAAIAAAGVIFFFAMGFFVGNRRLKNGAAEMTAITSSQLALSSSDDPVKSFWARFLGNDSAPVIAYPDAVFLLDDSNDLFRFRRGASDDRGALVDPHLAQQFASNPSLVAKAGQLYYENGYTGTGELQGIAMLSNLLGQMG